MNSLETLPLHAKTGEYHAVIETPAASRVKYSYDVKTGLFMAKRVLALGLVFPFPFGFLPSTRGADGDPLDVLVICDLDLPTGSLILVSLIGVIQIEQEEDGKAVRNDRFIAVPHLNGGERRPQRFEDLGEHWLAQIETFLKTYEQEAGKKARIIGRGNGMDAERLVEDQREKKDKS